MHQAHIQDLNLSQIAASGQCFRWKALEEMTYEIIAFGKRLVVNQKEDLFTFSCDEKEFYSIWYAYFDLDTDYKKIKESIDPKDRYLSAAISYGGGIRILKQDLWEVIISFLISQNNNIPRIKGCIERLCDHFGEKWMKDCEVSERRKFPTPDVLSCAEQSELKELGLGYRDRAIYLMAQKLKQDKKYLSRLKAMDYQEAHKALLKEYGIGKKVADCICLYGLYKIEAFPIDTHMKKIIEAYYPNGFPLERYQGYAGILQQYLFYYHLTKTEAFSSKNK